jgi:Zn-finger nucleic acid-binding protein
MEAIEYEGVEVDRCKNCKGIWFDVGESEWLFGEDAATAIDTGDPSVGLHTNQIDRYRCPRCDGGMMRRTDSRKNGIQYEECTSCRGLFLDAGEFTDLIKGAISEIRNKNQENT